MMWKTRIIAGGLILFLIAVVVGLLLLPKPTKSTEQSSEERTTNVKVMEVEPGTLRDWIELPASVEPYLTTEVAAEVEGRVDWIGPDEGDVIKERGTPLVRIDERTFRAQLDEAQAAHDLAADVCKRLERLHEEGIISDEQLDQCRTKVATDAARLEVAKIQLDKATVRAPTAGVLNKLYLDEGEYVRQGDRVAEIVVIDPVKVLVKVPEKDIPYIRRGQRIPVLFEFLQGKPFEGAVSYISVVGDRATRTYNVEITVDNPNLQILPSMIATVRSLRREIPDAITVPLFSVIPRGDYAVAFVEKDGKAEERLLELGILERNCVQIVKGIEPHERLIVEGHRELADGDSVQVRGSVTMH
jgi:membrane fusion protein (multidrug efflux system)